MTDRHGCMTFSVRHGEFCCNLLSATLSVMVTDRVALNTRLYDPVRHGMSYPDSDFVILSVME